jgi:hypothetical protein
MPLLISPAAAGADRYPEIFYQEDRQLIKEASQSSFFSRKKKRKALSCFAGYRVFYAKTIRSTGFSCHHTVVDRPGQSNLRHWPRRAASQRARRKINDQPVGNNLRESFSWYQCICKKESKRFHFVSK